MIEKLVVLGISFGMDFVFLTIGLLVMLRLQKLPYNPFGLFGTIFLTSAVDMIPYAGHFVAIVVLYLGLKLLTQANFFPDLVFTVGLPLALALCLNLYIVGAFMVDVRLMVRARDLSLVSATAKIDEPKGASGAVRKAVLTAVGWFHHQPVIAGLPGSASSTNATTNLVAVSTNVAPVKTIDPASAKLAGEVSTTFSLKGVSRGQTDRMAIIATGVRNYTIAMGESMSMETAKGKITVRLSSVEEKRAVLEVCGIDVPIVRR